MMVAGQGLYERKFLKNLRGRTILSVHRYARFWKTKFNLSVLIVGYIGNTDEKYQLPRVRKILQRHDPNETNTYNIKYSILVYSDNLISLL